MKKPLIFEPMAQGTMGEWLAKQEDWHRKGHDHCQHPWYSEPVPNSQRAEDLQYKLERLWLKSLPADTIVSCLNGEPVIAEERINTIEQILAEWYNIAFEEGY